MLASSGLSPARVILVVFATPSETEATESLNLIFGRLLMIQYGEKLL